MNETLNWKILSKLKPDFVSNIKLIRIFGETGDEVIIITKENNFYSFGSNKNGCLGLGHDRPIDEPTKVIEMSNNLIIDMSCGYNHVIALLKTGICYSWGRNGCGQLGIGSTEDSFEPQVIEYLIDGKHDIIAVSCGAYHSLVLTQTGDVYSFGNNIWGQLGFESPESNSRNSLIPIKIYGFDNQKVVSISCGFQHSLALTEKGLVFSWGHNSNGELGIATDNECSCQPICVHFKNNVIIEKIVCGFSHSLCLSRDGYVYGFGNNQFGQIGCGIKLNQNIPVKVDCKIRFKDIASDFYSNISVALSLNNFCYVWGECCHEVIPFPIQTKYKSIHDIYANYSKHKITYKPMLIENKFMNNAITESISQLFNNEKDSDIKFKVQNQYIFAHKLILKTRCNYFDSMLSQNWSENKSNEIEINYYSYDVIYAFLKYVYTDLVDIKIEDTIDLLDLANFYCEEKLINRCNYIIKTGTTVENVCDLFSAAVEHNFHQLIEYFFKFSSDKLPDIESTKAFAQMSHDIKQRFKKRFSFFDYKSN